MKKILILFFIGLVIASCSKSSVITIQAYGCIDRVEWSICNSKPAYLGEIQFIISKEGRSVKMTQHQAKGVSFFTEGTFALADCVITDTYNWSCKEKSPYGELYFITEMMDGNFYSSNYSKYINGNGLNYVGYQGIKGLLIKYDLWHPTDYFKETKNPT